MKPFTLYNLCMLIRRRRSSWVLEAHTCNPSCSGGRDQEDRGLKPVLGKQFLRTHLEKPIIKKGWWSGSSDRVIVYHV
jgi:hypothetical protein